MLLINRTYFVGELLVPNGQLTGSAVANALEEYINIYEQVFLEEILGFNLYNALKTAVESDAHEDRFADLINGVAYTNTAGKPARWQGLVDKRIDYLPQSPIANFVYYHFTRKQHTQSAAMGEVKSSNENSVSANPYLKLTRAWNEIHSWVASLYSFLEARKDIYPEWEEDKYCTLNKFKTINQFF